MNSSNQYILFYSRSCDKSYDVLDILRQNENANRQILKANLEDPTIRIPPNIRNMKTPVLLIHKGNQPPEIYQGADCFQSVLHLINKLSFFPKHQQQNVNQSLPPSTPGSMPRISQQQSQQSQQSFNNATVGPQQYNPNIGGGSGGQPMRSGQSIDFANTSVNHNQSLGGLMEYESSNQLSGMFTLINGGESNENHERHYSFINGPIGGQQGQQGQQTSSGGGQSGQPKSQLDQDYERFMRSRDMSTPRPIERH
jgi:hypothetical protein